MSSELTAPSPRVFISHSSADKERFVLRFAAGLRNVGVDAWVDVWEMGPGDSLVDKIFQALDSAAAVIVVFSQKSLDSRWVREELNAAVVERLRREAKLIPVVLDGLTLNELPLQVRGLMCEFVPDEDAVERVIERITRSVYGISERPPLGPAPAYTTVPVPAVRGLDRIDVLLLKAIGDRAIEANTTKFATQDIVNEVSGRLETTSEAILESLNVLDTDRLVKIYRTSGQGISGQRFFELTRSGVRTYLREFHSVQLSTIQAALVAQLIALPEGEMVAEKNLSEAVQAPRLIVDHVLGTLESRSLLKLTPRTGGPSGRRVYGVSPKLRRIAPE